MLMVLDPPTFMGSPQYEVPIKSHTLWCRSPIQYKGPISKSLKICLSSSFQHRRVMQWCLQKAREVRLVSVKLQLCQGSSTAKGKEK